MRFTLGSSQVKIQARANATLLLEIALRGGDLDVFDRVADVLEITVRCLFYRARKLNAIPFRDFSFSVALEGTGGTYLRPPTVASVYNGVEPRFPNVG